MSPHMKRFLFIRLSALGDVIATLPALSLLRKRYPDAKIGFVVEDRARDLIVNHPDVDKVYVFERSRWTRELRRPWSFLRALGEMARYVGQIRRERYEVALDFQGNLKGAVHALVSGARNRIGFGRGQSREGSHRLTNVHVTPPYEIHRVEKFISLLQPLGISSTNGAVFNVPVSKDSVRRIREFLKTEMNDRPYVVIHPGTSEFGKAKRWPLERFAEVGKKVMAELKLGVIVSWGPKELDVAQSLASMIGGPSRLSMKTESVLDLAEILKRSVALISADTGPMHLAAACGTPCIAIFGPKNPIVYRPYGSGHHVLRKGDSTMAVESDDVIQALREILKARKTA